MVQSIQKLAKYIFHIFCSETVAPKNRYSRGLCLNTFLFCLPAFYAILWYNIRMTPEIKSYAAFWFLHVIALFCTYEKFKPGLLCYSHT